MKAFQLRVVIEKRELDRKILRLARFLLSEKSWDIQSYERQRLARQKDAMEAYSEVLGERIANFEVR